MPRAEKVDALIGAATRAGERAGEAAQSREAEVFVVSPDVERGGA